MDFLPKEIEDIIIDYKGNLELEENRKQLNKEFKKTYIYYIKINDTQFFVKRMEGRRYNKITGDWCQMCYEPYFYDPGYGWTGGYYTLGNKQIR